MSNVFIKSPVSSGSATLSSGTVTVTTTKITATSLVFVTVNGGTLTHLGIVYEDTASRVAGTSFVIKSSDAADVSNVVWQIQEP